MRYDQRRPLLLAAVCAMTASVLWSARCVGASRGPQSAQIHEGDHQANYKRIFETVPPSSVEIVHSVVFEHAGQASTGPTPDWEIELLAPRSWIDQRVSDFPLSGPFNEISLGVEDLTTRQANRAREWYAPKPMKAYEGYKMALTSIPYVHLLVERDPLPDGRFRVFVSKH